MKRLATKQASPKLLITLKFPKKFISFNVFIEVNEDILAQHHKPETNQSVLMELFSVTE